ncbi:MAG: hypothetical protein HZA84_05270 [Thaumarchaeota archaeon]|nr:hypothetical protein [Nitrososphaerota archaeon]
MDWQTQNINGTIYQYIQTNDWFSSLLEGAIPALVAASVSGLIAWQTIAYSKKEHLRSALTDTFKMIGETPHKSAEENIYNGYRNDTLMKNGKLNTDHQNPVDVVRRNYDQAGILVIEGAIPKKQYYLIFGVLTVVSYFILKKHIDNERIDHKYFMAYFTNLAIDCFEFWNNEELPILDPKGNKITRQMLGNKIKLPK